MKIAVLGGELTEENYQKLDKTLNQLIEEKGIYLFYMICGGRLRNDFPSPTLGSVWADRNGAPVIRLFDLAPAHLINKVLKEADYIIFFLSPENQLIKNAMMKYKMMGKHGSVIV